MAYIFICRQECNSNTGCVPRATVVPMTEEGAVDTTSRGGEVSPSRGAGNVYPSSRAVYNRSGHAYHPRPPF